MADVKTTTIKVDGLELFYRSAGPTTAPVVLLLHGFPSSSHQFRNLIPLLSKRYRVLAPDLPGYGFTVVPAERQYKYNFDNLSKTIEAFVDALQVSKFAVYIFDYGAPTGLRLALRRPEAVTAIVSQNGNAYDEGFGAPFWVPLQTWWTDGNDEHKKTISEAVLGFQATKWQYENGSPHPDAIAPEAYHLDQALMERPGNKDIQLDLLYDYRTNLPLYPKFQEYFRSSDVPVLAIWGKNDVIFVPPGAEAFKKDVKKLEVHLLDAPHFAIETNEEKFAGLMLDFFEKYGI